MVLKVFIAANHKKSPAKRQSLKINDFFYK
nr:MAG TPA: hypothetical protein [Bacteriophage sp.]